LSEAEHKALVEMANIYGKNISDFVYDCIMSQLCSTWKRGDIQAPASEKLIEVRQRNSGYFVTHSEVSFFTRLMKELETKNKSA